MIRITFLIVGETPLSFSDVAEVLWGDSGSWVMIIVVAHEELPVDEQGVMTEDGKRVEFRSCRD